MTTSTTQVAAFLKALDAVNRHSAEGFAELFAEDAIVYDPAYPEPLRDLASIEQDIRDLLRAFPDLHATNRSTIENGEWLAVENSVTGTHRGPIACRTAR